MVSAQLAARLVELRELSATMPTIEQRRAGAAASTGVPSGAEVNDAAGAPVPSEWLRAKGSAPEGTVLYLHAGAFVAGSPSIARGVLHELSRSARVRFLSPAYRLAPEHPFPAALDDALLAYRWLLDAVPDPGRLAIGGTSAGGGLAMALMVAARDAGLPLPVAAFAICPWVDLQLSGASMVAEESDDPFPPAEVRRASALYLSDEPADHPLASPLFADLAGLPPVHLEVGTADRLVDDTIRLAARLEEAGVRVTVVVTDGGMHSFPHLAPDAPESSEALARVARHLRSHLSVEDAPR